MAWVSWLAYVVQFNGFWTQRQTHKTGGCSEGVLISTEEVQNLLVGWSTGKTMTSQEQSRNSYATGTEQTIWNSKGEHREQGPFFRKLVLSELIDPEMRNPPVFSSRIADLIWLNELLRMFTLSWACARGMQKNAIINGAITAIHHGIGKIKEQSFHSNPAETEIIMCGKTAAVRVGEKSKTVKTIAFYSDAFSPKKHLLFHFIYILNISIEL